MRAKHAALGTALGLSMTFIACDAILGNLEDERLEAGACESGACRDAGAVSAIIPASITTATSTKVILFIVVPPSGRLRSLVYARFE